MRRPVPTFALLALTAIAVVVPLLVALASTPAQAAGLDQKASYTCQYNGPESGVTVPNGLPAPVLPATGGSDDVAVSMTVDAPSKVKAGEALKLKGTATFTFGPNATATNGSTAFTFASDSFGVDVSTGGQHRFLRIAELTTTRSESGSSEVTARWTLPDYLVPSTATGQLKLSLPHEALATNPVSTSPESVAFTGELHTNSAVQPNRAVACALPEGKDQDTAIGAVRVAPGSGAATSTSGGSTSAAGGAAAGGPAGAAGSALGSGAPGLTPPGAAKAANAAAAAQLQGTLAGEPIPPQTVAPGLRLPAWAMPFVGAFVLGGPFLAARAFRRSRRSGSDPTTRLRRLAVPAALVLAVLAVVTPMTPQAPASAATAQAQITLVCVYEAEGSDPSDVPKDQPTGLSISLDVPKSVAPGEVITLTGSASVQAPEDIRRQASQFGYTTLDAISDSFSVGLTAGSGKRQVFGADRWQTGKTAFSNPIVVRGPLNFPAFKVPDDASGSIRLELPRNEVVNRRPAPYRNANTPPKVAVEFMASVTGNGTSATYIVSCWRKDNGPGLIAQIPVAAKGAAAQGNAASTGGTAGTAQAGGASTAAAPNGQALAGTTGKANGQALSGGTGSTTSGGPQLQGAAAPVSSQPLTQDVVVPTWLALLAVLLALAGYGFAGWKALLQSRAGRSSRSVGG
ncbi:MAG: DUF6801 domain-containing protein [Marmoricola sp.]